MGHGSACALRVFVESIAARTDRNRTRGHPPMSVTRRTFLGTSLATGAVLAAGRAGAASDRAAIYKQIEQRHDEAVQRLQTWIRQPSIAAENRGVTEGCDLTMRMLREAGFQHVEQRPTDGQPGIFATL